MLKRIFSLLLAALLCLSMAACDEEYDEYEDPEEAEALQEDVGSSGDPDQTWAIYWYLCGSDLESENGFATDDLAEMMEVSLPENVKVVIETGGAWLWMNDMVDADYRERYVYSGQEMELVDQQPLANMGDPNTLAEFLTFCQENYPADRTMVVFWNHGGGSVSGAAFDENFDYDALTLSEFHQGFDMAYDLSREEPPVDVIGFDTCLMGSIDTAAAFSDIARYMVASEEYEPGGGWLYSSWLQALAEDPGMDGARLGQHICDSYLEGCEDNWVEDEATLSLVDLSRIDELLLAYENMGREALSCALVDPGFFGDFGREAESSENYGGNTRDQGYANLVDLGDLARNCEDILPKSSEEVLEALDSCVLYQVTGPYRENATGLSCYYSYNGDLEDYHGYVEEGCSDSFKYLFGYSLEGTLPPDGMDYIGDIGYEAQELPYVPDLESDAMEEYPLYLDDEGLVTMELDEDTLNMLKGVYFQLCYVDFEEDIMLLLGQDNDIVSDWDTGVFKDNFRGVWGALDDHLVYMEVYYEGDDYTAYSVPILLNGREYSLRVVYSYEDEQFYILGARKGLDDSGKADRNLVQLKPGDEITTIHYACSLSGDDDFTAVEVDTFTVTEDTAFAETDLGNGDFLMMFELVDARNNSVSSQIVQFTVDGDYTDVEIWD